LPQPACATDPRPTLRLIDLPQVATVTDYDRAVREITERVVAHPRFVALYQIGHVSTPGISDLDLIVVFADDATCTENLRSGLAAKSRYLFAHDLWASSAADFNEALRFALFHNYRLVAGRECIAERAPISDDDLKVLRRQIALEYLLRIFISLTVERTYGLLKVRNLLLHAKALLFDCEYLSIKNGPLIDAIQKMLTWRNSWFSAMPTGSVLSDAAATLHSAIEQTLAAALQSGPLFLPVRDTYQLSRAIELRQGTRLVCDHKGIVFPNWLMAFLPKVAKLQNRFNRFTFFLPIETQSLPPIIREKFQFEASHRERNRLAFPSFMPLSNGISFV